jgi:hypothetical protein
VRRDTLGSDQGPTSNVIRDGKTLKETWENIFGKI